MPLTIQHSRTATTPDNTTAEIRPSHWNEPHVVSISLAGSEVIKYIGAAGSSQSSGTLSFSNSNGMTFGMAGGTITASHNGLTTQSVQTQGIQSIAAGGNTVSGGMVVFSNANNVSFGIAGSTVTGSASAAAQTNQTVGIYISSQSTGQSSSSTVDARSLTVVGAGGVSAGMSAGRLVISGATGGAADGINRLAAGTQTAGTNTTVNFADSNGITFGMSGSNQITASHNGLTSQSGQAVSAANGSSAFQTLSFGDSNGVSWSVSNGSVVASVAPGGGASSLAGYAIGNTAGDSSSNTAPLSSLQVRGAGIASVGFSADGAMIISVPSGGGVGDGANFLAAGTQTATSLGSVLFENSNGITFGMSGSTRITASHNGLTSQSNQAVSGANGSYTFQTLSFSNANGVSFGTSAGSAVTASVAAQTAQTLGIYGSSNTTGQSSSSTVDARSLSFRGAGAASVGLSGGEVVISVAAGAQSNQTLGIYVTAQSTGQSSSSTYDARSLSLVGDGIVSLGWSNGTLRVSATQSNQAFSAPGGSSSFQTLNFANSNGVSFSNSNGSVVGSVAAQTAQTIGVYASSNTTAQSSSSTVDARSLSFRGVGALSVGMSAGEVILSVAAGAQSNQTGAVYAVGNTTGQSSSSTYDARTLSMDGAGIVSVGWSNGTLRVSATQSNQAFSAAGGSSAFQTLGFSNANGATFTNTNGSVGLSYTVPTQVSAYATSNTTQSSTGTLPLNSLIFAGAGAASVGISNGSVVISAPSPGAASLTVSAVGNTTVNSSGTWPNAVSIRAYGVVSVGTSNGSLLISTPDAVDFTQQSFGNSNLGNTAGDTGVVTGRLVLVGTNGITLSGSTDAGSMTLSISGGGGGGSINLSAGTTSNNLTNFVLSNSNGMSFGLNGSTVTASHNGLTSQSNQAASAANGSFAFQTVMFSNVNGISFGTSPGSAITASWNSTHSHGNPTLNLTNLSGTTASASNGLTLSLSAAGQAFSAQGGSSTFQTLEFANSNGVSWTNSNGSVVASVAGASAGIAAFRNSETTYTSGTVAFLEGGGALTIASTTGQQFRLSVPATSSLSATGQVSISTNGSTISIGVPNLYTETNGHAPYREFERVSAQIGQGSLHLDPHDVPNIAYDRVMLPMINTNSSNSSGSHTLSFWLGLYTRNVSTLSLLGSTSVSTAITQSGTVGSYSLFSGQRLFSIGSTTTLTQGKYWMAFLSRTTSGGADGSYSNVVLSQASSSFLGVFGQAANASRHFTLGQGFYSATTSAMPASIPFSDIVGSNSNAPRMQVWMFANSTV